MAAIVEIDEQNGKSASPTLTHNITTSNMGSFDSADLNPTKHPIAQGENSFEKWQLIHVTDMGTASEIKNIRIWRSGILGENAVHVTNLSDTKYLGETKFQSPTSDVSSIAIYNMPNSIPGSANLGIGGSLTGVITKSGYSDFLVHQIQTTEAALSGSTTVMNYSYDETA